MKAASPSNVVARRATSKLASHEVQREACSSDVYITTKEGIGTITCIHACKALTPADRPAQPHQSPHAPAQEALNAADHPAPPHQSPHAPAQEALMTDDQRTPPQIRPQQSQGVQRSQQSQGVQVKQVAQSCHHEKHRLDHRQHRVIRWACSCPEPWERCGIPTATSRRCCSCQPRYRACADRAPLPSARWRSARAPAGATPAKRFAFFAACGAAKS